jgi:hypothetical protein
MAVRGGHMCPPPTCALTVVRRHRRTSVTPVSSSPSEVDSSTRQSAFNLSPDKFNRDTESAVVDAAVSAAAAGWRALLSPPVDRWDEFFRASTVAAVTRRASARDAGTRLSLEPVAAGAASPLREMQLTDQKRKNVTHRHPNGTRAQTDAAAAAILSAASRSSRRAAIAVRRPRVNQLNISTVGPRRKEEGRAGSADRGIGMRKNVLHQVVYRKNSRREHVERDAEGFVAVVVGRRRRPRRLNSAREGGRDGGTEGSAYTDTSTAN